MDYFCRLTAKNSATLLCRVTYGMHRHAPPLQAPIEIPSIAQVPTIVSGAGGGDRSAGQRNWKGITMSSINPVGNGWNIQNITQQPILKSIPSACTPRATD